MLTEDDETPAGNLIGPVMMGHCSDTVCIILTNTDKLNSSLLVRRLLCHRSVGIATGYGLGGRETGVRFPAEARDCCSLFHSVQTGSGAHPASYTIGTGALSPGGKRQWREADHSPASSAVVKNNGAIPLFPIRLHRVVLIN
jgi:hypothetical protein